MSTPEDDLYELLGKEANETTLEDNEDDSTVGTLSVYEDPKERESGTIDAHWGDTDISEGKKLPSAQHHSTAVDKLHADTREGVLDRSFSGKAQADQVHQALINENFAHAASGDYSTHSTHLKKKSVEKVSHVRTPTLLERVKGLTGYH